MQSLDTLSLEAGRQADQLAFVAGGQNLLVGEVAASPWSLAQLLELHPGAADVVEVIDSGLTAMVYRLRDAQGRHWTLKRARPTALVRNVDGETSFLNEVQRRFDLEGLRRAPGGEQRWQAIVPTAYASYRDGVILSPWIDGHPIDDWDEQRLSQVLQTACALWLEGLFEWDLCRGNLLDDGRQVRWFDFGYMYRFDPLRHFNSAGHGDDEPLFHPAERFETRNFSAHLLQLERSQGAAAALAAFRLEKAVALETYRAMRAAIAARGAQAAVLAWLDGITCRWADALQGDAQALYLSENWRSHALDLDDDLRGQSCTPMTLQRADWLLEALRSHGDALRAEAAFFWGDKALDTAALIARYAARRRQAEAFQLPNTLKTTT